MGKWTPSIVPADRRGLLMLAVKLAVAAALAVWVALAAANYITNAPNVDPLTKTGWLDPVQRRPWTWLNTNDALLLLFEVECPK